MSDPGGYLDSSGFHFFRSCPCNKELAKNFPTQFEQGQIDFVCERYGLLKFWANGWK
jgi:hypothetical protein